MVAVAVDGITFEAPAPMRAARHAANVQRRQIEQLDQVLRRSLRWTPSHSSRMMSSSIVGRVGDARFFSVALSGSMPS